MTGGTRDGRGRFARTIRAKQRDFDAAALRAQGWSFQRIANELGYSCRAKAYEGVLRAYAEVPAEAVDQARQLDLERIDRLIEQAWDVMTRVHFAHGNGRVVSRLTGVERDEDGRPLFDANGAAIPKYEDLLDDGPVLAAVREIRRLLDRRAKILGYDAPARRQIEVITEDMVDAEIARLTAELGDGAS